MRDARERFGPGSVRAPRWLHGIWLTAAMVKLASAAVAVALALPAAAQAARSLDGHGNNLRHPAWGRAGTQYLRVARPDYADGIGAMVAGPSPRYVSNRVFNDVGQNLFSERGMSQWVWAWGQFIDHDIGLADETPGESAPMAFDPHDPLEGFTDDVGGIDFNRTPAAPGTGVRSPRQQINTVSSYIDASSVYGETARRLAWLRTGRENLLLPGGYLPRADARANPPAMDLFGAQPAAPGRAVVAGDVRANENIALTAIHTLFAREHNRIVARCCPTAALTPERRSRSPGASSARRSSTSPTTSSCRRSACGSRPTAATGRTSTRASGTSSPPSATGRTA